MKNTINERFNLIIKELNLSPTSFSRMINVSQPSMKAILDGNTKPSFDTIEKLLRTFPIISTDWLINGSGDMYKDDYDKNSPNAIKAIKAIGRMNSQLENISKTPGYSEMLDKISELSGKLAVAENRIKELEDQIKANEGGKLLKTFSGGKKQ